MVKLAEASNTVIYKDDNKLYISKRPASWTTVFLFVTGLIALILLVNGILQVLVFRKPEGSPMLGIILIVSGVFFALIFQRVKQYQQKINAAPLNELKTIAIIDLANNSLYDGQQNILTTLDQAWLTRKMQLTSSSSELILQWKSGALSIVKGNPFSGGIGDIEKALVAKGIRKK